MSGILVVQPRRIRDVGRFTMGQADDETQAFIAKASVDQIIAVARGIDAGHVLVSQTFGRLISGIMTPVMTCLDAALNLIQFLGLKRSEQFSETVTKSGRMTTLVSILEDELLRAGNINDELAAAIIMKDPSVRSVYYRNSHGQKEMVSVGRGNRDVSLIVNSNIKDVIIAHGKAKDAIGSLGYSLGAAGVWVVIGVLAAVAGVLAVVGWIINSLTSLVKSGTPMREVAQIRNDAAERLIKLKNKESKLNQAIAILEEKGELDERERDTLSNMKGEIDAIHPEIGILEDKIAFIDKHAEKFKQSASIVDGFSGAFREGLNTLMYVGIGAAALIVFGTVLHFVTR